MHGVDRRCPSPGSLRPVGSRSQLKRDPLGANPCLLREPVLVYIGSMTKPAAPAPVVHSDPRILGGTPVFVGTRVPAKTLFDYLEAGDSLDRFLDQFPTVTREQAVAALDAARDALMAGARSP